jgi:hypothetical protein
MSPTRKKAVRHRAREQWGNQRIAERRIGILRGTGICPRGGRRRLVTQSRDSWIPDEQSLNQGQTLIRIGQNMHQQTRDNQNDCQRSCARREPGSSSPKRQGVPHHEKGERTIHVVLTPRGFHPAPASCRGAGSRASGPGHARVRRPRRRSQGPTRRLSASSRCGRGEGRT